MTSENRWKKAQQKILLDIVDSTDSIRTPEDSEESQTHSHKMDLKVYEFPGLHFKAQTLRRPLMALCEETL